MRQWQEILITILVFYLLIGLCLFLVQKKFIYYPDDTNFEQCIGIGKASEFNGTRFYENRISDRVVVFYHGNAGSACERKIIKDEYEKLNISTIIVEYTGYSADYQKPSKKALLIDADNAKNYANDRYNDVIIMGASIGGFFASRHAKATGSDLILVAPASSIKDVANQMLFLYPLSLLLVENQDNIQYLTDYKRRVLIFHGTEDEVINLRFSQKLYDAIESQNKQYIIIIGAGHNDILHNKEIWERIAVFTAS